MDRNLRSLVNDVRNAYGKLWAEAYRDVPDSERVAWGDLNRAISILSGEVINSEYERQLDAGEFQRHHEDFDTISNVCMLVREGRMTAEAGIRVIQNVVG